MKVICNAENPSLEGKLHRKKLDCGMIIMHSSGV
jgi:hypothetical protein